MWEEYLDLMGALAELEKLLEHAHFPHKNEFFNSAYDYAEEIRVGLENSRWRRKTFRKTALTRAKRRARQ